MEEGERALSYKEPTRKSRYTQVAAWRPSSQGGRFPSWRYRAQHSAELFHLSSLDDGRPEAAVVAGGVRAVVVVPGPNYGAQGRWCRRAEVLVALLKSESSNR